MADNTARGRFVWHELTTPNADGAQAFYTRVLGWRTESWDQDRSYTLFAGSTGPLAGSSESHEAVPYWVPYVSVPDVYTTIEQAKDLGAAVVTQPTSMPDGGRHASLTDPHGALFGIYSSPDDMGPDNAAEPGEFSWHELATTDNRAAFDFYSALFGWELVLEHDMGPMGVYLIFGRNDRQVGGMFNKGDQGKPGPAYWLNYVRVEDVNDTLKKVEAERGSLVTGPMEVPGGDLIAQFIDPYGALFAVHTVASEVKSAAKRAAPERETVEQTGTAAAAPRTTRTTKATRKKTAKKTAHKSGKKKSSAKRRAAGTKAAPSKKRGAEKKAAGKKAAVKKTTGKKSPGKKAAGKKAAGGKTAGRKAAGKKAAAKKAAGKKSAGKKTAGRKSAGKKATGKKRASKTGKKASGKKTGGKKAHGRKTGGRKTGGRKSTGRKSATKKTTGGRAAKKKSRNKRAKK